MRVASRFVLSLVACVALVLITALAAVGARTRVAAQHETTRRLTTEAALVARAWQPTDAPAPLADSLARALGRHLTLLASDGRVLAESGTASAREISADARGAAGTARIGAPAEGSDAEIEAQRGVLLAALVGLGAIVVTALLFQRAVARPVADLRVVARALAHGDVTRRATRDASDEIGDIAWAINRMGDQLGAGARARAVESDLLVALSESLTEAIVAVDAHQSVVYANDTARRLLDLRLPVPFRADHLPRDTDLREALRDALAGTPTGPVEIELERRSLALTARPLTDGAGAVLTFFDLTPMRRLEAIRRDFVANVSHELKTPLTVVGGFAETLADDDLPAADRKRFAETIRVNAQRMQRIVDDLLDLSRIESGGWRPMPSRLDVAAAAEEAATTARDAAARKGVAFSIDMGVGAESVRADATALRQVLSNLVENAVRHTASGSVAVTARRDAAREGVWLGVRDTGSGIPPEHLPRIFERFYRADPARSREAGGTGLGLAIVKHLVEAHGGEVRAESTVDAGTTIEGFFPDAAA